ncbi:MAG: class I SAM-dependent methyltransferase [Planctomycetota bacterium]|nr:MAG: class I SAM-dependent methyltransferase [Planctomycetota bacterium]REJ91996.1 MAG: class I SAM-dependent methyltransferase [Planctomycetota bacterium]REK28532.1 MAG: class I SAM-dependent methyltransferase [Planctomycetota bacterium]REK39147.1 MAG: class I SAM-dependent methyltransferase [Planctomycetota bacterium]
MPRALWQIPLIALRERFTPPGRARQLEPMLMDELDSVAQFHQGGATSSGMRAVHDLSARCLDALLPKDGRLLDLGCGSGRALAYLALRRPDITVTGVDLATNMLAQAQCLMDEEGIADRVRLIAANILDLPSEIMTECWSAVSCVWTLHHLPDEQSLQAALEQVSALRARHHCALWILDFQRLRNEACFPQGLSISEPDLDARLRLDAIASEAAAFTYQEFIAAASTTGLTDLLSGYARPLAWQQAHWQQAANHAPQPSRCWRPIPLKGSARLDAALLRFGFCGLPR